LEKKEQYSTFDLRQKALAGWGLARKNEGRPMRRPDQGNVFSASIFTADLVPQAWNNHGVLAHGHTDTSRQHWSPAPFAARQVDPVEVHADASAFRPWSPGIAECRRTRATRWRQYRWFSFRIKTQIDRPYSPLGKYLRPAAGFFPVRTTPGRYALNNFGFPSKKEYENSIVRI